MTLAGNGIANAEKGLADVTVDRLTEAGGWRMIPPRRRHVAFG